jgi:hypothetical protein
MNHSKRTTQTVCPVPIFIQHRNKRSVTSFSASIALRLWVCNNTILEAWTRIAWSYI